MSAPKPTRGQSRRLEPERPTSDVRYRATGDVWVKFVDFEGNAEVAE